MISFNELDEDSLITGPDEAYLGERCDHRFFALEFSALAFQFLEIRCNIVGSEGYMVQSPTGLFQKIGKATAVF